MPWAPSTSWWHSARSEEHTSELQSRRDLVCRLLLAKKKDVLPSGQLAVETSPHLEERGHASADCGPAGGRLGDAGYDFFFFNNAAPPKIYPLPLPAPLPI